MKSFSAFLAKGEELAKQVASQATALAEKAKQEEWVNKVTTSVNEAVQTIKTEYKQALNPTLSPIREVGHNFISIDFPSERVIESLGTALREKYHDNILIVNMSEREYNTDLLPGHVLSLNFRGLPAPPLEILCRLCLQIHQWLSRSPSNVVAVHCFPGLSRSAVLICSYLAWAGVVVHPVDALVEVCAGLKIDVDSNPMLPSQKRYLNYFFDMLTSASLPAVPARTLSLKRLILNGVPNLPISDEALFRPFFEVWKDGRIVYTSLPSGAKDMPVEALVATVPAYHITKDALLNEDSCVASFDVQGIQNVSGDLLVRLRHLTGKGGRFTCVRFAFNTNYVVDGLIHLARHELDGTSFSHCMVDLAFEVPQNVQEDPEEVEENARIREIFNRSRDVSRKLRQGVAVEDDGDDIEEVLLMKALGAGSTKPTDAQVIGKEVPVMEMTPTERSGDDVDDFFAQLEKDAQI